MRLFFLLAIVSTAACGHATGVHTFCNQLQGGGMNCVTRDFDAENREEAARQKVIAVNACVEGFARTSPTLPFSEARDRCDMRVAAQFAAAEQAAQW